MVQGHYAWLDKYNNKKGKHNEQDGQRFLNDRKPGQASRVQYKDTTGGALSGVAVAATATGSVVTAEIAQM